MTVLDALVPITDDITSQTDRLRNTTRLLAIFEQRLVASGHSLADIPYSQVAYIGSIIISFSTANHEQTAHLLSLLGGQWDKEPYVSGQIPYVNYRQRRPEDDELGAAAYDQLFYSITQASLSPGCALVEEDVPPDEIKPLKRFKVVCGDPEPAKEEVPS